MLGVHTNPYEFIYFFVSLFRETNEVNLALSLLLIIIVSIVYSNHQGSYKSDDWGLAIIVVFAVLSFVISMNSDDIFHEQNRFHIYTNYSSNLGAEFVGFFIITMCVRDGGFEHILDRGFVREKLLRLIFVCAVIALAIFISVFPDDIISKTSLPINKDIFQNISVELLSIPVLLGFSTLIEAMAHLSDKEVSKHCFRDSIFISTLFLSLSFIIIFGALLFNVLLISIVGCLFTTLTFSDTIRQQSINFRNLTVGHILFIISIVAIIILIFGGQQIMSRYIQVSFVAEIYGAILPLVLLPT